MNGGGGISNQDWYECTTLEDVHAVINRETRGFNADQVKPCSKLMANR